MILNVWNNVQIQRNLKVSLGYLKDKMIEMKEDVCNHDWTLLYIICEQQSCPMIPCCFMTSSDYIPVFLALTEMPLVAENEKCLKVLIKLYNSFLWWSDSFDYL